MKPYTRTSISYPIFKPDESVSIGLDKPLHNSMAANYWNIAISLIDHSNIPTRKTA